MFRSLPIQSTELNPKHSWKADTQDLKNVAGRIFTGPYDGKQILLELENRKRISRVIIR